MSSQFQGSEIPGMGSMNDPLGFVKKLWGDMQIPGMVTPTISVDELDKKIKDLKAVESWLNVNMNMLRGTIQAMEVQRATIATLKSMSESFSQQMGSPAPTPAPEAQAKAEWPMPPAASAEEPAAESKPKSKTQAKAAEANSEAASQFTNPAAWWGLLQDQFKQAVSQAMETEAPAKKAANAPASAAPKATKKAPAKPVVKKSAAAPKAASKRASP